jgi:hypothetical protein
MVETPQQLMTRLAGRNRVLFVDQPVAPLDFLHGMRTPGAMARKLNQWRKGLRHVSENIWVGEPPPVLPLRTNPVSNRVNTAVLRRWLSRQVRHKARRSDLLGFSRFPNLSRDIDASLASTTRR